MKTLYINLVVVFMIFALPQASSAQRKCKNYHAKHCRFAFDENFRYSGQSRSALMAAGQTSNFFFLAYQGRDYSISVCGQKNFGDVQWRLLEEGSNKVLFDNSSEDFIQDKIFTIESTQKLVVEVTTPENPREADLAHTEKEKECVGVLIEYMKTPIEGF